MSEQRIYKAISEAMRDIEPIAKSRKNLQQGFQYRGVDDIMNELQPILIKHGIFIIPEVLDQTREERQTKSGSNINYSIQKTAFHFTADDGSEVTAVVVGEGMDSGDKASNKALAVAFKYACLQVFCIPTEDPKDPDNETPPPSTSRQQEPSKNTAGNQGALEEQRAKIVNEIKNLTKEQAPDGTPYFAEEEIAPVRDIVKKTGAYDRGIKILADQLGRLKELLKEKVAAHSKPADKEFVDDILF
jgi:hypothetical protein